MRRDAERRVQRAISNAVDRALAASSSRCLDDPGDVDAVRRTVLREVLAAWWGYPPARTSALNLPDLVGEPWPPQR